SDFFSGCSFAHRGRFAESSNHSRQSFYHPGLWQVYTIHRQSTRRSAWSVEAGPFFKKKAWSERIWWTLNEEGEKMSESQEQTPAQKLIGPFLPKMVSLTDDVLFGDIWERRDLSKRDRSLITVTALIAGGNTE